MHVNKVSHVKTISLVAKGLGESEDWLFDVANEMDVEDGVIWVQGLGDDGVMAFTDFGIENLVELIKIHKELKSTDARSRVPYPTALRPTPDAYPAKSAFMDLFQSTSTLPRYFQRRFLSRLG